MYKTHLRDRRDAGAKQRQVRRHSHAGAVTVAAGTEAIRRGCGDKVTQGRRLTGAGAATVQNVIPDFSSTLHVMNSRLHHSTATFIYIHIYIQHQYIISSSNPKLRRRERNQRRRKKEEEKRHLPLLWSKPERKDQNHTLSWLSSSATMHNINLIKATPQLSCKLKDNSRTSLRRRRRT